MMMLLQGLSGRSGEGEGGRGGLPAVHARAAWEARPAAEHRTRIAVLGRGAGGGGGVGGIVRSFFVHLSSGAGLAASRLHSPMLACALSFSHTLYPSLPLSLTLCLSSCRHFSLFFLFFLLVLLFFFVFRIFSTIRAS